MASMKLTINGVAREVKGSPDMPLLWVLRDLVGLTGTKFGCGMALCGACTVRVDGAPRRSCVTPVAAAVGKAITTIEGDRKSTRLNSSHLVISYAVFCLKKKQILCTMDV